jgi:type II secretory ATPase GspE/PulE/Tfp pilus assembly ATPase PilB-like protein
MKEKKDIKKILLDGGYVSEADMKKAEEFSLAHRMSLIDALREEDFITQKILAQAIAESLNLPFANFDDNKPNKEDVLRIPKEIATKNRVVVYKVEKNNIVVATDNPHEELLEALVPFFDGFSVSLSYALTEDIDNILLLYRAPLNTRFNKIIKEGKRIAPEIISEVVNDAFSFRASDIHFEPLSDEVVVRFRVDGVLHEAGHIPKDQYENILNRIKVQGGLHIDEHFSAQDGAIRYEDKNAKADLRVSIVPTVNGEKAVFRILSEYVRSLTLSDLGVNSDHEEILIRQSKRPFGMILVTGPTGSGKSTTLYALLKNINRPEINVTTIENPVEYKVDGINQIQVNNETNLSFAEGLRAIVRQDPDTILVGEIRDKETAEIGVNAALTGHMLLSTFHTNNASTAVPRLLDMGVEPFLLASTLNLVVAERLVRKICSSCKYSATFSQKELMKLFPEAVSYFPEKETTLFMGKGCGACGGSGYQGRVGIFELIEITPKLKELILKNPSAGEIWQSAKESGSKSLFDDGIIKVESGVTTIEELLRVAEPA